MERTPIAEFFVDDIEDEILLVKRIDEIVRSMNSSTERLVVVLFDEEVKKEVSNASKK